MELTRQHRVVLALAALAVAIGLAAYDAENVSVEPVAIVAVQSSPTGRVVVVIDRCESEATVTQTSLNEERLVVEVSAQPGWGDCQDTVDVAVITNDIRELEDVTSGMVFVLRSASAGSADRRSVGTRE